MRRLFRKNGSKGGDINMRICKRCGQKHSWFNLNEFGYCSKCWEAERPERERRERQERMEIPTSQLKAIIAQYALGAKLEQTGIACWGRRQDKVNTMIGRTIGLFFLGPLGSKGEVIEYTYGVISSIGTELFILEFGTSPDENIKAEKISANVQPKIQKFPITDIEVKWENLAFHIRGAINLDATFPDSYSDDNSLKGRNIVEVINGLKARVAGKE